MDIFGIHWKCFFHNSWKFLQLESAGISDNVIANTTLMAWSLLSILEQVVCSVLILLCYEIWIYSYFIWEWSQLSFSVLSSPFGKKGIKDTELERYQGTLPTTYIKVTSKEAGLMKFIGKLWQLKLKESRPDSCLFLLVINFFFLNCKSLYKSTVSLF